MKTVLGYLRPHAGRVAAGAAIKFTAAVLELILPLLLAEVIDELVPAGDTAAIWRTGGWMSLLALGAVGCNITANRMAAWVSMEMTRVLRQYQSAQHQHGGPDAAPLDLVKHLVDIVGVIGEAGHQGGG